MCSKAELFFWGPWGQWCAPGQSPLYCHPSGGVRAESQGHADLQMALLPWPVTCPCLSLFPKLFTLQAWCGAPQNRPWNQPKTSSSPHRHSSVVALDFEAKEFQGGQQCKYHFYLPSRSKYGFEIGELSWEFSSFYLVVLQKEKTEGQASLVSKGQEGLRRERWEAGYRTRLPEIPDVEKCQKQGNIRRPPGWS